MSSEREGRDRARRWALGGVAACCALMVCSSAAAQSAFDVLEGHTAAPAHATSGASSAPGEVARLGRGAPMALRARKLPALRELVRTRGRVKRVELRGESCGGFAVFDVTYRDKQSNGAPRRRGKITRIETGEVLAEVDQPDDVRCVGDYMVVGTEYHGIGALDVREGTWSTIPLVDPSGRPFADGRRVVPIPGEDGEVQAALILGSGGESGRPDWRHGLWKVGQPGEVVMRSMPFALAREASRVAGRVLIDAAPVGTNMRGEQLVEVDASGMHPHPVTARGEVVILGGGWVIMGDDNRLLSPDGEVVSLDAGGCAEALELQATWEGAAGQSALFRCRMASRAYKVVYWTPSGAVSWQGDAIAGLAVARFAQDRDERALPVVPLGRSGRGEGMIDRWFDLRSGGDLAGAGALPHRAGGAALGDPRADLEHRGRPIGAAPGRRRTLWQVQLPEASRAGRVVRRELVAPGPSTAAAGHPLQELF